MLVQVHVQVQAFLTLPDLTAEGAGLEDRCQVIQPFSIETAVDHCVEPTSTGNYRCRPLKHTHAGQHAVLVDVPLNTTSTWHLLGPSCLQPTLHQSAVMLPAVRGHSCLCQQ